MPLEPHPTDPDKLVFRAGKYDPPQREWQGLTDEEIREAWFTGEAYDKCFRMLEQKLKEKNT